MRLNDSVIAHIAKLLQLGILTGTDIIDHLRMIRLRVSKEEGEIRDELFLSKDYKASSDSNIEKMINEISSLND